VVTGIGLHTPLGDTADSLFDALLAGRSATEVLPDWAAYPDLNTAVGARVKHFDGKHIPRKSRRTMGRVGLLAASAAERAVEQAGLTAEQLADGNTAVVLGSTGGSSSVEYDYIRHLVESGTARGLKSTAFFQAMSHTCAANVALHLGIRGELFATNSACSSSNQAVGLAAQRIRDGYIERAVAGGAEELHLLGAVIFHAIGAASAGYNDQPGQTPRPFDAERDGIVVGEGAGVLVLEERQAALARGAPILGEVLGFATLCDAVHIVSPQPEGMERTIRRCLPDAGLSPDDVDYVNAHATGTRAGDASEALAIQAVFGERTPVSSIKGQLGHTLGACGAIESAVCLTAMARGTLPANHNLALPDVAPIDLIRSPRETAARTVLNTNFAFGGVNSCLLFRRPGE
jgi:3-oxoacyl-[acyl-carrier-protein] synthase II